MKFFENKIKFRQYPNNNNKNNVNNNKVILKNASAILARVQKVSYNSLKVQITIAYGHRFLYFSNLFTNPRVVLHIEFL